MTAMRMVSSILVALLVIGNMLVLPASPAWADKGGSSHHDDGDDDHKGKGDDDHDNQGKGNDHDDDRGKGNDHDDDDDDVCRVEHDHDGHDHDDCDDDDDDDDDDDADAATCAAARCAVQEEIDEHCPCDQSNHGKYVACVAKVASKLEKHGDIPHGCHGSIVRCAAKSRCGFEGSVVCDVPSFGTCNVRTGKCVEMWWKACRSVRDCPTGTHCQIEHSARSCISEGGTVSSRNSCCVCEVSTTTTTTSLPASTTTRTSTTSTSTSSSTSTTAGPVCGNGIVEGNEQCDPPGSATCGSAGGALLCQATCICPGGSTTTSTSTTTTATTSSSTTTAGPVCGNGILGGDEQCDPPGSATCGSAGGALVCQGNCTCPGATTTTSTSTTVATTQPPTSTTATTTTTASTSSSTTTTSGPVCGNGILEPGEECDGSPGDAICPGSAGGGFAMMDTAQEVPTPFLYTASLDSAHEVPAPTVGSPAPTGTAGFALLANNTVRYTVRVQNLTGAPTAAHIHEAPVGTPGPVIVPLDPSAVTGTSGTFTGTSAVALSAAQVVTLNAGGLYVNVHTATNASGEIRGQIGGIPHATGVATFLLNPDHTLTYSVTFQNLSGPPIAAHVHEAAPGVPGPVRVPLNVSGAGTSGTIAGTSIVALTDDQVIAFLEGGLYVNFHTALNPSGELRGQILVGNRPTCNPNCTLNFDQCSATSTTTTSTNSTTTSSSTTSSSSSSSSSSTSTTSSTTSTSVTTTTMGSAGGAFVAEPTKLAVCTRAQCLIDRALASDACGQVRLPLRLRTRLRSAGSRLERQEAVTSSRQRRRLARTARKALTRVHKAATIATLPEGC